jgi:hypothetical protein
MTAWIDEFRVIRGQAAWTANFTLQYTPYTTGGDIAAFNATVADPVAPTVQLAAIEASDIAALRATATWLIAMAAIEAPDTAALNATATWAVQLAATEASDIAALNATATWAVRIAATEASDTAALNATATWAAALTATEASDTAALRATVFDVVSVSLAATEAADTAAFSGSVTSPGRSRPLCCNRSQRYRGSQRRCHFRSCHRSASCYGSS